MMRPLTSKRALVALAVLFFACTAWLGRPVGGVWNSPDEAANAFWATRVAHGASLFVPDAVVALGHGAIHPRSVGVREGALVPGSFPGIFLLYGILHLMLRLPFYVMTPLFTAIAGLLLGALVARLFDRKTGFWTSALFFTHPAVIYYASRGLFHNMLFVDLLIVAASFFVLHPLRAWFGRSERVDDILGGFFFGWAIATRASEALWALPAFLIFLPFAGTARWRRLGRAALGAAVPLFILLTLNARLYGSPFRTAYAPPPVESTLSASSHAVPEAAPAVTALPFGFHPRLVLAHVRAYGLALFWWQTLLAAAGFLVWLLRWKKTDSAQKTYAGVALAGSAWIAILYGSWLVRDRFDPADVTIGVSYVRYFLPIYLAALPFGAYTLVRFGEAVGKPKVAPLVVLACAALSIHAAVFSGDESLMAVRATQARNAVKREALLREMPEEAVFMTERFDKLVFPDRLRIIPSDDEAAFAAAAEVASDAPVYWYGLTPSDEELATLMDRASRHGLEMVEVESPNRGESAYLLTLPYDKLPFDDE